MNIEQEIRAQIEKNKGLKLAVSEINNHLSILEGLLRTERADVQKQVDEAYHKGWEYGKEYGSAEADMREAVSYQRGLNDAWEAARKISLMPPDEIEKVFPGAAKYNRYNLGYSGVEVIEKLKAYEEQKADDEIKVGDEVEVLNSGNKYPIAWFAGTSICGFSYDGITCRLQPADVRKTGKHYDIDKILEAMKE